MAEDIAEELKMEIIEEIESAYRPPTSIQIVLYLAIIFTTIGILVPVSVNFEIKILALLFVATYFYPLIIKSRGRVSESISIGLFSGTIAVFAYFLLKIASISSVGNLAMLVMILEVMGIELLHHVSERFKFGRNKIIWAVDAILTVIFFVAMFQFIAYTFETDLLINILASVVLSMLFFLAVMPEKPF